MNSIALCSGADILVDSAGTSSFHIGEPADKRMRIAALKRGYGLTSRSRLVSRRDFSDFDLVIAMDRNNYRELSILAGRPSRKLVMLSDYLGDDWPRDVPDPYHGGDEGFEKVLDMLEEDIRVGRALPGKMLADRFLVLRFGVVVAMRLVVRPGRLVARCAQGRHVGLP